MDTTQALRWARFQSRIAVKAVIGPRVKAKAAAVFWDLHNSTNIDRMFSLISITIRDSVESEGAIND